jgi:hypothetical protein
MRFLFLIYICLKWRKVRDICAAGQRDRGTFCGAGDYFAELELFKQGKLQELLLVLIYKNSKSMKKIQDKEVLDKAKTENDKSKIKKHRGPSIYRRV